MYNERGVELQNAVGRGYLSRLPAESSATRVKAVREWGGGDGTRASKGGREPGNCREPTTIPPDVSLSSITRIPKRDLTTFRFPSYWMS